MVGCANGEFTRQNKREERGEAETYVLVCLVSRKRGDGERGKGQINIKFEHETPFLAWFSNHEAIATMRGNCPCCDTIEDRGQP